MRGLSFGAIAALTLILVVLPAQLRAEDIAHESWQEAITGQIEALRRADGAAARAFSGSGFQGPGTDPTAYVRWVRRTGYGPLIDSVSHAFGMFEQVGERRVLQIVTIVGFDHKIYEALYRLTLEADGWRVQEVRLRDSRALAI